VRKNMRGKVVRRVEMWARRLSIEVPTVAFSEREFWDQCAIPRRPRDVDVDRWDGVACVACKKVDGKGHIYLKLGRPRRMPSDRTVVHELLHLKTPSLGHAELARRVEYILRSNGRLTKPSQMREERFEVTVTLTIPMSGIDAHEVRRKAVKRWPEALLKVKRVNRGPAGSS
jgi:hypothetical protein